MPRAGIPNLAVLIQHTGRVTIGKRGCTGAVAGRRPVADAVIAESKLLSGKFGATGFLVLGTGNTSAIIIAEIPERAVEQIIVANPANDSIRKTHHRKKCDDERQAVRRIEHHSIKFQLVRRGLGEELGSLFNFNFLVLAGKSFA